MTPTAGRLESYFATLSSLSARIAASSADGRETPVGDAVSWAVEMLQGAAAHRGKVMFVGNGGSASIASHMAIDFSKNGGIPGLAFNDGASLTCLANDLGYENVFAHHVRTLGHSEDALVAISSSGESRSIIKACEAAREIGMPIITMSGFASGNSLRSLGNVNFYVPTLEYGFAEITHLALCHAILDLSMGWRAASDT